MTYYSAITDGKKLVEFKEITKEMFDNATSKETIKWFLDTFDTAIETKTSYGHKSARTTSELATHYISNLDKAPQYIKNHIKQA